MFVVQDAQGFHHRVVVVQRFAHAHEHDVERLVVQTKRVCEHPHLPGNLAGGQIANEPHLPGQAERARHGASDLRRDAERHGGGIGNEHRFDLLAVGEPEQELLGAIRGLLAGDDDRRGNAAVVLDGRSQTLGQVGHGRDVGDAALVDPREHLARAKAFLSAGREDGLEFGQVELGQIDRAGGILHAGNHFHDSLILAWVSSRAFAAAGILAGYGRPVLYFDGWLVIPF